MRKLLFVILTMIAANCLAQDWGRFRGPNGSGISETAGVPVEFGLKKNLIWRTEVPFGRSSPILTQDHLVVTASEGNKLITLCLDRATGKIVWRNEIVRDRTQKIFRGNDSATPTPASDGRNFYVFFPDLGMVSYDPDGKERWRRTLGPFDNFYGLSSSPILHGSTLVLVCDQSRGSFIIALDKDTGRILWRKERYQGVKEAATMGFSTPIVWTPQGGKAQVIVSGAYRIDAYAIDSGENLWWVRKQGTYPIVTPVLLNDVVFTQTAGSDAPEFEPWDSLRKKLDTNNDGKISFQEAQASSDYRDHFGWADRDGDGFISASEWEAGRRESVSEHGVVAVRVGGAGDQTEKHLIWRYKKGNEMGSSPLIYQGVLYTIKTGGIVTALDPATGEELKVGRTKDAFGEYYASLVAADGRIYVVSMEGKVSVLKAGTPWEILAVNDLGEECQATPAIGAGRIYIRTAKAVYCFGEKHK